MMRSSVSGAACAVASAAARRTGTSRRGTRGIVVLRGRRADRVACPRVARGPRRPARLCRGSGPWQRLATAFACVPGTPSTICGAHRYIEVMPRGPAALLHGLERVSASRAAWVVTLLGAVARALYFRVPAITGSDCDAVAYMEVARHLRAGHGFVTNSLYHLWVTPAAFPRPESLWNPLQPYAIAALGAVVPDLWLAGKLVALGFGLSVPALTLLATE